MSIEAHAPAQMNGPARRVGLSGKLLLLTILFVMIAEILIYVPSIANFRMNWLRDRLASAHTAALVLDAAPRGGVPESLTREILTSIGAHAVAVKMGDQRRLLAQTDIPDAVDHDIDIRTTSAWPQIRDAFDLLLNSGSKIMRVVGPAPGRGEFIEVILNEAPLRTAMFRFSVNILLLSLVISAITAAFVYLALHYLFVRPMRLITANLMAFHADPENQALIIRPSVRTDEIGIAERELAGMQSDLVSLLKQKTHLAELGLAVSKINHDLRNLLSSAQLISDQLASVADPRVQRFAPKLVRTLERAIAFCQSTLSYGAAREPLPDRKTILVESVAADVRETLGLGQHEGITWVDAYDRSITIDADPEHLFRVLLNLARNAMQALEAFNADGMAHEIRLSGRREGSVTIIDISDTGPGVPQRARDNLFKAFHGATRAGGTGLGLAIAAELIRAHHGTIELVDSATGATFRIIVPDRPVPLHGNQAERGKARSA